MLLPICSVYKLLTVAVRCRFWDVLFAPVAGAFETAYQSAPLDLGEDSFALGKSDLVLLI